ncbi:MAG TPA: radical SAM protein [Caldisericia bacterium]|nr:radical SAM protein [Caldisericia bacterium]
MRASYGSLQLLGLRAGGYPFSPRAVFLLIGDKCSGGCSFCPQSVGNSEKLSRVTWPVVSREEILDAISEKPDIDRICVQAVRGDSSLAEVVALLTEIKKITKAPVSVSMSVENFKDAKHLFSAGASNISVALDCSSKELAGRYKDIDFEATVLLLKNLASQFPGRVTTHIIAGLGETDAELVELVRSLIKSGVIVSLFAFTPIDGTELENQKPPELKRYRRLQATLALLQADTNWKIEYGDDGFIINIGNTKGILKATDFQVRGCPGCNRPYYNERPGGIIYNHPNPPDLDTVLKELDL